VIGFHGQSVGRSAGIRVGGVPTILSLTVANQTVAIPTLFNGEKAQYLWLPRAAPLTRFAIGMSTANKDNGPLLSNKGDSFISCAGFSHFGVGMVSGTHDDFCVVPIEPLGPTLDYSEMRFGGDAISSIVITTGATIEMPIPLLSDGRRARFVHLTGHNNTYFMPGFTGDTIHGTPPSGVRLSTNVGCVVNVSGYTHILTTSGLGSSRFLSVTPLEE
jgi:hypothetical protein